MRITKELLLKIARQTAEEHARSNHRLACIYLTGSLLTEEPLLGQTTDIDLVFVHSETPEKRREIIPINEDIHIDIAHVPQSDYHQPRTLRGHPWLAPFLCKNPICLYDTRHWFEFTQAAVCAQINRPEYVHQRASVLAETARQKWMDLSFGKVKDFDQKIINYLDAIFNAANAVAVFSGTPLTERRFLLNFPDRAAKVQRPGLAGGLVDLFTVEEFHLQIDEMIENWLIDLDLAGEGENPPPHLHPSRRNYLSNAVNVLKEDYPAAALWILLRSWSRAYEQISKDATIRNNWLNTCQILQLDDDKLSDRLSALDAYLDVIEETLDVWAENRGLK